MVPLCMVGAWGIAAVRGRSWCNWMCPRGAFSDLVLARVSPKRKMPAWLRSTGFRVLILAALVTALVVRLSQVWGDPSRVGLVFLTMLTITTGVAVVLALTVHQRAWCTICPAGTVASWIGRRKAPHLLVDQNTCRDCNRCAKVCPVQLRPADYRSGGVMTDADCLKCGVCVTACPTTALQRSHGR
jgi:polyferredoxin